MLLDTDRKIPDYLTDSGHAEVLRRRVEAYYHNQGMHHVKAWIESEKKVEDGGARFYYVRSNLVFKVPT